MSSMAKGKNPAKMLHDWVMVATFKVTEQTVEQLAAARVDPSGNGRTDVQMSQETMETLDGPGCRQCGVEWTVGYGTVCPGKVPMPGMQAAVAPDVVPVKSGLILPNGQGSESGGLFLPNADG